MAQITCSGLSVGYDSREILHGLNFTVNAGDYLYIVGENGSGKTTLMNTIIGFHQANSGQITFGDGLIRREIGYLPQQTVVQKDFPASVREIVMSGFEGGHGFSPFYTSAEKSKAVESMEKLGIKNLERHCYRDLSGGQQQRVLLARALCATKKMLLLDEPVSGLDPKVTTEMYRLIDELNKKDGITVIMISHDLAAAMTYASHILHIGESVFFGTRDEYRNSASGRIFAGKDGGNKQ